MCSVYTIVHRLHFIEPSVDRLCYYNALLLCFVALDVAAVLRRFLGGVAASWAAPAVRSVIGEACMLLLDMR